MLLNKNLTSKGNNYTRLINRLQKWLFNWKTTSVLVIASGGWLGHSSYSSLNLERALTAIQRPYPDQREWGWREIFNEKNAELLNDLSLKRINKLLPKMNDVCLHDAVLHLLNVNKFGWAYQPNETLIMATSSFIKSGHPASAPLAMTLIENAPLHLNVKNLTEMCHYASTRADLETITKLRNAALLWAGSNDTKVKILLKSIDRINQATPLPWEQLIWTMNEKDRNLFFLEKNKLTKNNLTNISKYLLSNTHKQETEQLLNNFTKSGKNNPIEMAALALKINQTEKLSGEWLENFKTSVRIAGLLTACIGDHSRKRREMLNAQTLGKSLADIATLAVLPIQSTKKNKKYAQEKASILALSSNKITKQAALIVLNILNDAQADKLTYRTISNSINPNITIALTSIFHPTWLKDVKSLKDATLIAQALKGRWEIDKRHLNARRKDRIPTRKTS